MKGAATSIAYLGPAGTFSEEAAIAYMTGRDDVRLPPLASMPAVVTAIETGASTVGILPIMYPTNEAMARPSRRARSACASRGRRAA